MQHLDLYQGIIEVSHQSLDQSIDLPLPMKKSQWILYKIDQQVTQEVEVHQDQIQEINLDHHPILEEIQEGECEIRLRPKLKCNLVVSLD